MMVTFYSLQRACVRACVRAIVFYVSIARWEMLQQEMSLQFVEALVKISKPLVKFPPGRSGESKAITIDLTLGRVGEVAVASSVALHRLDHK